jgi:hypothetical protein
MASKSDPRMTAELERARAVLTAYGASPEGWPDEDRELVRRALEGSDELRQLAEREGHVDAWLDSAPELRPHAALVGRLLAAAPPRPSSWTERLDRWASELWSGRRTWTAAVALSAATALGVGTGLVTAGEVTASGDGEQAANAVVTESDAQELGDFAFDDFSDLGETP